MAERQRLRALKGRGPWEDWLPQATWTLLGCHPGRPAPETAVGAATVRCGAVWREARHPQPQAALPHQDAPWANRGDPRRGESPEASSQDMAATQAGPPARAEKHGCLSCRRTPDRNTPSPEPLFPGATRSSTAQIQRSGLLNCMPQPRRPPPVSHRSQGLWPVASGSFPLPPTWLSSPALHASDRRGLLQKIPYCQRALAAASLHHGWRITRSPACPSAGADDPGWNLNSPAPPPFIIPAAVCHYTLLPPPRSFPLAGPAMCQ